MTHIAIVAAKRTVIGRFLGKLSPYTAVDLACLAGEAVLKDVDRSKIDQVILGNVLAAGQGMNIARQIGVKLGLPLETPAHTINMMCGSGLQAVLLAAQAIRAGEAQVVLCGGTESMSQAPFLLSRARTGYKLGDGKLEDVILRDGLVDSFSHQHMAHTVEALCREFQISRAEQDEFAARSQANYFTAQRRNLFTDEIIAVDDLTEDEHPRVETTVEKLTKLKPSFEVQGTITAGNASGINDGAALLVVADLNVAKKFGWPCLALLELGAVQGCDPQRMAFGPVHAVRKLLSRGGQVSDYDVVEINEAFAAQTLLCLRELQIDPARLNPAGGAIALGHPIGASGARLAVHLAHRLARGEIRKGLATLCVGGGMGIAASFQQA